MEEGRVAETKNSRWHLEQLHVRTCYYEDCVSKTEKRSRKGGVSLNLSINL